MPNFVRYCRQTKRIIDSFIASPITLPRVIMDALEKLDETGPKFVKDPKAGYDFYNHLTDTEAKIRFHAASHLASPSMAAFSARQFEEMLAKKLQFRPDEISNKRQQIMTEEIVRLQTLFHKEGPKRGRDYTEEDNNLMQYLVNQYNNQRWQNNQPTKAR